MKKVIVFLFALALVVSARFTFAADGQGLHLGGLNKDAKKAKIEAKKSTQEAEVAKKKAAKEAEQKAKEAEKTKKKAAKEAEKKAKEAKNKAEKEAEKLKKD